MNGTVLVNGEDAVRVPIEFREMKLVAVYDSTGARAYMLGPSGETLMPVGPQFAHEELELAAKLLSEKQRIHWVRGAPFDIG